MSIPILRPLGPEHWVHLQNPHPNKKFGSLCKKRSLFPIPKNLYFFGKNTGREKSSYLELLTKKFILISISPIQTMSFNQALENLISLEILFLENGNSRIRNFETFVGKIRWKTAKFLSLSYINGK
jgi:hypothetical protein